MACCRALSRLPLAASVTTEVIINSIYKIMYVQNRKVWRREGNRDKLLHAQDYKKVFPRCLFKKRLVTGAAGLWLV